MKKSKKERGGIFLLLIRNYIFFSIAIVIIGIIISSLMVIILNKKMELALGLSDKDIKIISEERFNKLDSKLIAGHSGIIEILDENNNVIYTSSDKISNETYTEKQLNLIPYYEEYRIDTRLYEFKNEDNKKYKLLISTSYNFDEKDDIYYDSENSWFKILDDKLNVVYEVGKNSDHSSSYTEEELGYLTGEYPRDYTLMKYTYVNNNGKPRTVIIKEKKTNDEILYKRFNYITNGSLVVFLLCCVICIIVFGIILKGKVKKPLDKLNRAMQLLSEGKNNEHIVY